jgi:hypothetical protein
LGVKKGEDGVRGGAIYSRTRDYNCGHSTHIDETPECSGKIMNVVTVGRFSPLLHVESPTSADNTKEGIPGKWRDEKFNNGLGT